MQDEKQALYDRWQALEQRKRDAEQMAAKFQSPDAYHGIIEAADTHIDTVRQRLAALETGKTDDDQRWTPEAMRKREVSAMSERGILANLKAQMGTDAYDAEISSLDDEIGFLKRADVLLNSNELLKGGNDD